MVILTSLTSFLGLGDMAKKSYFGIFLMNCDISYMRINDQSGNPPKKFFIHLIVENTDRKKDFSEVYWVKVMYVM